MGKEAEITAQAVQAEVEKILASQTLRGKETLRSLLSYLVEKTLNGSPETLKEYTIGVEAFGKPETYDPQEDASVRVQVGRLRQKLEEYYRTEGAQDALVIELPKRQFALLFHEQTTAEVTPATKPEAEIIPPAQVEPAALPAPALKFSWPSLLMGMVLMGLIWAGWQLFAGRSVSQSAAGTAISPELAELWQPFFASERPITMAMTMRPFLRYDRGVIREWNLSSLEEAAQEQRMRELKAQLKTERLVPWEKTYTSFGEATGIFLLTRLFEREHRELQLKRQDALTWEDLAAQNVIFVGSGKAGMFERIPVQLAFTQINNSILNLQPRPGEPAEFKTPSPDAKDFMQREDYALISVVPGLHGKGEIIAFGGASSSGLWAAVEYLTEPRYARELLAKLKGPTGKLPRHYQVVIHARFESLVPVAIEYLAHREL